MTLYNALVNGTRKEREFIRNLVEWQSALNMFCPCKVSVCLMVFPELEAILQLHQGLIKNFPRTSAEMEWGSCPLHAAGTVTARPLEHVASQSSRKEKCSITRIGRATQRD